MKRHTKTVILACAFLGASLLRGAAQADIEIDIGKSFQSSGRLWGIFFEEINRAGSGGLCADMVMNGSFEDARVGFMGRDYEEELLKTNKPLHEKISKIPYGWHFENISDFKCELDRSDPIHKNNPTYLKMSGEGFLVSRGFEGNLIIMQDRNCFEKLKMRLDLQNPKNGGIAVKKGDSYKFKVFAKSNAGAGLDVSLVNGQGAAILSGKISKIGKAWKEYVLEMKAAESCDYASLKIKPSGGEVCIDNAMFIPEKTWKNGKTILREDLMELLEKMKPSFLRFPGGCYVEGYDMHSNPKWKTTIGPRQTRASSYAHWGYSSDNLLGFHEFLEMCELLGAEPMYVVNCGMSHWEKNPGREFLPLDELDALIQDALDALEYANGDAKTTKWGKIRAKNGHPKPFNIKLLEIGNENEGPFYSPRYVKFYDAVKKKYPDIALISAAWFTDKMDREIEIRDFHHYGDCESFLKLVSKFDKPNYGREKNPPVYFGEYAVTVGQGQGNVKAAVAEAAAMTGIEKNSDVVLLSSFAPLLRRRQWDAWPQAAILFDGSKVCPTPSYHVQAMFSQNRIKDVFDMEIRGGKSPIECRGPIGFGIFDDGTATFKDIKISVGGKNIMPENAIGNIDLWIKDSGKWHFNQNNELVVNGSDKPSAILIGNKDWKDYTFEFKVKKEGGFEGIFVYFSHGMETRWNIGGWGNRANAVQRAGYPDSSHKAFTMDIGRFVDVKVEVRSNIAKLYMDGLLIDEYNMGELPHINASAGRGENGDIILKFSNFFGSPSKVNLKIKGLGGSYAGRKIVLAIENPLAENSLENPNAVIPRESGIFVENIADFSETLPANSVSVIRLKPKK